MPTTEPTAEELREARSWRVVSLCCDSSEPDWRSGGQSVAPGDDVMVRLQGVFDGRCGLEEDDGIRPAGSYWDDHAPELALDGVPLRVRPLFPTFEVPHELAYGRGPWMPDWSWLGAVPADTHPGLHTLTVRHLECSWSAELRVGRVKVPPPPVPVISDSGWLQLPGYAVAMWECDVPYDATAAPWIRVPPKACAYPRGWAGDFGDDPPEKPPATVLENVLCVLDASGNALAAYELRFSDRRRQEPKDGIILWGQTAAYHPVPLTYPACRAMR